MSVFALECNSSKEFYEFLYLEGFYKQKML